ncbi:PEGA domain-containing protein [Candidatus Dependentiae bacterium]|nr:PEGA domain-containing protein [Candidatus Dependentiae bacterium]
MTGAKLYAAIIVVLIVLGSGAYVIMDIGAKSYALSGDEDDTFSIDYVNEGESYVSFTSNPSGASVEINDETYTTPTGDIKLDPGSYSYSVSLEDYASANGEVSVEDGKSRTLNIILESAPALEPGETPIPEPTEGETPTLDGTPTPTPTEDYDIPFMGVDVRIVAGTPFQGVKFAGAHDEAAWLDVQGKYLYLTKNNEINLKQISKYPNGVGNTLIEYDDDVPTGWNEFEHLQTWGQDIEFRLKYTGSSTTGTIGEILLGHFSAPDSPSAQVMKINIVPKHYGFWFDVQKKDDAGPIIVGNKAEPVGIYGSSWALATIASWDFRTMPVIRIDVSNSEENLDYDRTTYKLYNWAFWTPETVDSSGNWIGGEASTRVVIRGSDADNFDSVGSKELYLQLMDQERYGEVPYMNTYKITYDVSLGNIDNIKVTKID